MEYFASLGYTGHDAFGSGWAVRVQVGANAQIWVDETGPANGSQWGLFLTFENTTLDQLQTQYIFT
ncbi:MAG: hypothetical protein HY778_17620 [Betaproteobacteria bacterium]|nr:hypothetical protein [Betaproteobacteria bacterium]